MSKLRVKRAIESEREEWNKKMHAAEESGTKDKSSC